MCKVCGKAHWANEGHALEKATPPTAERIAPHKPEPDDKAAIISDLRRQLAALASKPKSLDEAMADLDLEADALLWRRQRARNAERMKARRK